MMRRLPRILSPQSQATFTAWWPWALGGIAGTLYLYNPEPFDDMAGAAMTKARKPLLAGTEWLEMRDADPETIALELPPDQLFGPLPFKTQMKFLLGALKADNELADGYLARLCIDNMDLSTDKPVLEEKEMLENGAMELLDFAVADFTEQRVPRKHKFFHPDNFVLLMNWLSIYPSLADHFVTKLDGVPLLLQALKHAKEDYSRVFVMRCLMLYALQQRVDGDVERRILANNGFKDVVECYRQSTGDPTDTRFLTSLISSICRHYPDAAALEFKKTKIADAVVAILNISKYKGVPQHLRVIEDLRRLPKETLIKAGVANGDVDKVLYDNDAIPVLLGIVEVFPEYYESVSWISKVLKDLETKTTPFELLEYKSLIIFSKLYARYREDVQFQIDGTRSRLAEIAERILEDKECQKYFDPSVSGFVQTAAIQTMQAMIAEEKEFKKDGLVIVHGKNERQTPQSVLEDAM